MDDLMNNKRSQGGFTLIEIMVVVAVIGVMMAGAIELFDSLTKGQRVRSASFDLYSGLSVARSEALKRGTSVTITPGSGTDWAASGWAMTYVGDHDNNPATPDQPIEIKRAGGIRGVTITPNPTPLASLVFARTGRPASTPSFQIDVTTAHRRCIKIDLSGSPRTTPGACT
jgi:type IV fimbrial biogenesis protein FimT